VHVAFAPAEATAVPTGIVVDVLRASSTIVQALESGYRRVLCCAEVGQAQALREEIADAVLAGERQALRVEGFDFGNSPRDFLEPKAETLILTTTNGTRAIVEAAADCDVVFVGPARLGDELVAEAAERRRFGRSGVYDVTVRRADGTVLAEFRGHSRALPEGLAPGDQAELGGTPEG